MGTSGENQGNEEIISIAEKIKQDGISHEEFQAKIDDFDRMMDISELDNKEGKSSFENDIEQVFNEKILDIYKQKTFLEEIVKQLKSNEVGDQVKKSSKKITKKRDQILKLTEDISELEKRSILIEEKIEENLKNFIKVGENISRSNKKIIYLQNQVDIIKNKIENGTDSEGNKEKLQKLQNSLKDEKINLSRNKNDNEYIKSEKDKHDNERRNLSSEIKDKNVYLEKAKSELNTENQKVKDISEEDNCSSIEKECKIANNTALEAFSIADSGHALSIFTTKRMQSTDAMLDATQGLEEKNEEKIEESEEKVKEIEEDIRVFQERMKQNKVDIGAINNLYNEQSKEFYHENPKKIINITDQSKLKEVLLSAKCNPGSIHFIEFINDKFLNNIEIISLFIKKSKTELNTKDIKGFDFLNIDGKEFEFFSLLKSVTLNFFMIKNYTETDINEFINNKKYSNFKKVFLEAKNTLKDKKGIKNFDIGKFNFSKINTNSKELDNSLVNNIKENSKLVFNLFKGKNIDQLYRLPKVQNEIMSSGKYIKEIVSIEPLFYDKFLGIEDQHNYSIEYINGLLTNSNRDESFYSKFSKMKFRDIANAVNIFKQLTSNNIGIDIDKLLSYPQLRSSINNLMDKTEDINKKINELSDDERIVFQKMQEKISSYYEKSLKIFEKNYNESGVKKSIEDKIILLKTNEENNILFNDEKFIKLLNENGALGNEIKKLTESIINNDKTTIKKNIRTFSNVIGINNIEKFREILSKIKNIAENIKKEQNKNSYNKLSDIEKNKLLQKDILDEKGNISKKEKVTFLKYIIEKKEEAQNNGEEFDENKYIELFLQKYYGLNNESKETIKKQLKELSITKLISTTINKISGKNAKKEMLKLQDINSSFFDEIDKEIFLQNQKEIQEYEKKYGIIELPEIQNTEGKETTIAKENYSYSPETGIITANENGEANSFELSKQDKEIVKEKPELLEKIVDFHKTLNELGLNSLWAIKDKIFQALTNTYGSGFEIKGDYLNKNETFIFLNSILKSVGEKDININASTTIDGFKNHFKKKNNLQFNGGMKDNVFKKGESNIEEIFLEKYVNNFSAFQIGKFKKSLNINNKK